METTTTEDLLAAVKEKPEDVGLVRVYADRLLDGGDIRGEVIALLSVNLGPALDGLQAAARREAEMIERGRKEARYPFAKNDNGEDIGSGHATVDRWVRDARDGLKRMILANDAAACRLAFRETRKVVGYLEEYSVFHKNAWNDHLHRHEIILAETPGRSMIVNGASAPHHERIVHLGHPVEPEDIAAMVRLLRPIEKAFRRAKVRVPTIAEESVRILRERFGDKPFRWKDASDIYREVSEARNGKAWYRYRHYGDTITRWLKPVADKQGAGGSRGLWKFKG